MNARIAELRPNRCCSIVYTSGTSGDARGAMLSHDNFLFTAAAAARRVGTYTDAREHYVSYLPLSHIVAQVIELYVGMLVGARTYFAQPDALSASGSLVRTLRRVRPTTMLGVPRVWEKIEEAMMGKARQLSSTRRRIGVWAKSVGLEANLARMEG